jgi:energy-coupling factor transport system permease protein
LGARLTIFFYGLFVISLFFIHDVYVHTLVAAALFLVSLCLLPHRKLKSGLLPIAIFLLFTFAGNLFFHPGKIVFTYSFFSITNEGITLAGIRTLRVFSLIFAARLLTSLLTVDRLILALEGILAPLEKAGVPIKDFFLVMGLTLKAFPALTAYLLKTYREEKKVAKGAQGVSGRIAHMVAFLMPVFVKSIQSPEVFFRSSGCAGEAEERR